MNGFRISKFNLSALHRYICKIICVRYAKAALKRIPVTCDYKKRRIAEIEAAEIAEGAGTCGVRWR
jgi:hypothetical protein